MSTGSDFLQSDFPYRVLSDNVRHDTEAHILPKRTKFVTIRMRIYLDDFIEATGPSPRCLRSEERIALRSGAHDYGGLKSDHTFMGSTAHGALVGPFHRC